jgi:hypothetical protein
MARWKVFPGTTRCWPGFRYPHNLQLYVYHLGPIAPVRCLDMYRAWTYTQTRLHDKMSTCVLMPMLLAYYRLFVISGRHYPNKNKCVVTLSKEMEKIPCTLGHYDAATTIGNTGSNLGIDTIPIGGAFTCPNR